jgi:ABC-type transport system involved in cytochrome c biogenesis permease subunit
MAIELHQGAAATYLLAGLVAWLGLAIGSRPLERGAVLLLLLGGLVHLTAFGALHVQKPPPPLTDLPAVVSFTGIAGTFFFLGLMRRVRLAGLTVLVAPVSFLAAFFAALRLPHAVAHAHVVLGSMGLALLGLSGLAGLLFLAEHRRIKGKRRIERRFALPSLEALDRVNRLSLAVGFPLLTLGVLTGMMWQEAERGRLWAGTHHEMWCAIGWAVYGALVAVRFAAGQGARQAALSSVGAFAFLAFAVVGVELLA